LKTFFSHYLLPEKIYTPKNDLFWKYSQEHFSIGWHTWQITHVFIAILEAIPIVGQILSFVERHFALYRHEKAKTIQKVYRTHLAKRHKKAAIALQTACLAYLTRVEAQRKIKAYQTIQKIWRIRIAKRELSRLQVEKELEKQQAAETIQKICRTRLAKKELTHKRNIKAAIALQSACKVVLTQRAAQITKRAAQITKRRLLTCPKLYSSSKALSPIFGFLSSQDLVQASLVSHIWRDQTRMENFSAGQCLLRTPGLTTPIRLDGFGIFSTNSIFGSREQREFLFKARFLRSELWYKNDKERIVRDSSHLYPSSRINIENESIYTSGFYATTFKSNKGTIVIWPNGDAVRLTDDQIGGGSSKTVYKAYDLRSRIAYAAACTMDRECDPEIYRFLKGKRGIAQIYNDVYGEFYEYANSTKGPKRYFFYGELYDTDLSKRLGYCSLEDVQVIVKDLLYAIIALEGNDPKGDWIQHGDIKDANIFLKIDKTTDRVVGAYLGDFGMAAKYKTIEVDEETLKMQKKKFGAPRYASRETQRNTFMSSVFHQIKKRCEKGLKNKAPLADLCIGDPTCQKLMEELEKKYGYILERRYFHLQD